MAKFEFKVTKIGNDSWTYYISIRATDKLTAFARIREIFPMSEYKHEYIGTE